MIVGLVALYMPKTDEVNNISKYIDKLDYCYLLDDSATNNQKVIEQLIKRWPKKVEYHLNHKNIGLCRSVNNGFKMAIDRGADWVLVMNPDGTFANDSISIYKKYIETHETSEIGIICPQYNVDRHPRKSKDGFKLVKFPDMTGCLYNVNILKKIGYFDINTYFYGLDTEFCLRIRKEGYKILQCSEAVLNHNPGKTYVVKLFGKTIFKCGIDNPQRYYYQFRSAYYICKKYHSLYCFTFHVYKFLKVLFFFKNKVEYFKMIFLGIKDAKKKFYGNIKDRKLDD